jgi:hypothetical protein
MWPPTGRKPLRHHPERIDGTYTALSRTYAHEFGHPGSPYRPGTRLSTDTSDVLIAELLQSELR